MLWLSIFLLMVCSISAEDLAERRVEHAGSVFRVVAIGPQRLGLVWRDADGRVFETFDRVQASFGVKGAKVRFLMNAGIFEPGLIPSGLHVEDGKLLRPLNRGAGAGNFYLKPNGVFAVTKDGRATVVETSRFQLPPSGLRLAVQSGPLLLTDGKRHPAFREGSESVKHRNGVGVDDKGRVVFAMTDKRQEVNFWDFAGLFLKLGCKEALFLDGDISQMAVNPEGKVESNRFAAMFVVVD